MYVEGQPGSPVIALTAALQHSNDFPVPIQFLFIEEDEERFARLTTILQGYKPAIQRSSKVRVVMPRRGDCDSVLTELLDECDKRGDTFGPALAFLDQFGYSAASMQLVARILAFPQCEVFSYLDFRGMNRWINDPSKAAGFDRAWGGSEWREAVNLPESERRIRLLESYKDAIRTRADAKYVCSFSMFDKFGSPLYWLIFSTNHLRGLEEMKKAMWSVDKSGGFKFSDQDNPKQIRLLREEFDQSWLAEELCRKLAGKTMTVAQLKEYVLTCTPCYLFRDALKRVEMNKKPAVHVVKAPAHRKPGTFPEDDLENIVLRFREAALF